MTMVDKIESLSDAALLGELLDKAATENLAGISHQPIEAGAALRFFEAAAGGLSAVRSTTSAMEDCYSAVVVGAWLALVLNRMFLTAVFVNL